MAKGKFRLVDFEEGGPVRSQDSANLRLVCITNSDERLVIWGEEGGNRTNIDKVLLQGLPCEIICEYIEPTEAFKERFGHGYWVPHDAKLEVV